MAELGRIDHVVRDSAGAAVSGGSVTVYKAPAIVSGANAGTAPLAVNIDSEGGLVASDQCQVWRSRTTLVTDSGGDDTFDLDSITGSVATLSGFAGTLTLQDDDVIVPINNAPTLYVDPAGVESIANPLTSASDGSVSAYVVGNSYTKKVSGSGITTTIFPHVRIAAEHEKSNILSGASEIAKIIDTLRTLTAGRLLEFRNNGTARGHIDYRGWLKASNNIEVFNAESSVYGAVGDNATDSHAAITAALAAASAQGGGIVYLPTGFANGSEYITSDTISVPTHCVLMGNGKDNTVIKAAAGFSSANGVVRIGPTETHWAIVQDLAIDCRNIASIIGLLADGAQEYSGARDIEIINNAGASSIGCKVSTTASQNCYFQGCGIGSSGSSGIGIHVASAASGIMFRDCSISASGANGIGVKCENGGTYFDHCHVETNTTTGIGWYINAIGTFLNFCDAGNCNIGIQIQSGVWDYTLIGFHQTAAITTLLLDENNLGSTFDITGTSGANIPALFVSRGYGGKGIFLNLMGQDVRPQLDHLRLAGRLHVLHEDTVASATSIDVATAGGERASVVYLTGSTAIENIKLDGAVPVAADDGALLYLVNSDAGNITLTAGTDAGDIKFNHIITAEEGCVVRYRHADTLWWVLTGT